jgi:dedicator of cytokinesis protein 3
VRRVFRLALSFCSAINLFSHSRPVTKGPPGEEKPHFRDIWTEKTYFSTEETFPTVLRRSEIFELQVVEISPLESALLDVETRNKELAALETKYSALAKTQTSVSATALAMALNAAVDTPPDAGIPVYRDGFFRPEYLARNPQTEPLLQKLKAAIDEQVRK